MMPNKAMAAKNIAHLLSLSTYTETHNGNEGILRFKIVFL